MSDTAPKLSPIEERRLRQAEALRANLARRKSQARARADDPGDEGCVAPPSEDKSSPE